MKLIHRKHHLLEEERGDRARERALAIDQATHIAMRAMGGYLRVDELEARIKVLDLQGKHFNQRYLEQQTAANDSYL